jgi:hypothetical protein
MFSVAAYLRRRPESVVALNWVHIQRLELDIALPFKLFDFFTGITVDSGLDWKAGAIPRGSSFRDHFPVGSSSPLRHIDAVLSSRKRFGDTQRGVEKAVPVYYAW